MGLPGGKYTTYVLNFGHPLSPSVMKHLDPALEVRVQLNLDLDSEATPGQVQRIVDEAFKRLDRLGVPVNGTFPVVIALPGISEGTALILAELTGRIGSFPKVLALRRAPDGTWGLFRDSAGLGILDLEKQRQAARGRRG